jgi:hypothetical protein
MSSSEKICKIVKIKNSFKIGPEVIFFLGLIIYSTTAFFLTNDEIGKPIATKTLEFCAFFLAISILTFFLQKFIFPRPPLNLNFNEEILKKIFITAYVIAILDIAAISIFFHINLFAQGLTDDFLPSILKNFLRFNSQICLTICALFSLNKKIFIFYVAPAIILALYQAFLGDRTGIILGLISFIVLKNLASNISTKKISLFFISLGLLYLIIKPLYLSISEGDLYSFRIIPASFESISFATWINSHYLSNCVIPVFPNIFKSFNSLNQHQCFPNVTYGLASNFWLDVFLSSGFFGIFLVQILIYTFLNFLMKITSRNLFAAIAFFSFFPYFTFYISRNDSYNIFSFLLQFCLSFGCIIFIYIICLNLRLLNAPAK